MTASGRWRPRTPSRMPTGGNVDSKLDDLTAMVRDLTGKAGKRWDKAMETVLVAVITGAVCFLLGRLGL